MQQNNQLTIPALFSSTVAKHGENKALGFAGGDTITYRQMHTEVLQLIESFRRIGIEEGDRVAILSTNMPRWATVYFAIASMGAVAVPLLPEFLPSEVTKALDHSETKAIFVSQGLRHKIKDYQGQHLQHRLAIENLTQLDNPEEKLFDAEQAPTLTELPHVEEDTLASIIYTSGTTGSSKGVMLSHKNLSFDALGSATIQPIVPNDRFLSILPLSHTYENTLGLLLPMFHGACVYYLSKPPIPSILLPALKQVRPTLILSVPLIIEKMFRGKIYPALNKTKLQRTLYKVKPVRKLLHRIAGKKMYETFGGKLKFFGIGGAKLDRTVEQFLLDAKFPYAIGYGLTETAPLLAGAAPFKTRLQSTGPAMEGVELKIHNPDSITGEGEIWGRGPNVMLGYYKDPELTKQVITPDGWFKTGDLGVFDKQQQLFIKGRTKNMIIGANGKNIYPEDIESIINNFRYVVESVVVEQKGKLVALVHFNREELEKRYLHYKQEVTEFADRQIEELRSELQEYVNARVNKFSRVQLVISQQQPFQKTATHKIKRYMYNG
ncbi:MAG: AMP-binding protein [Bacteroidales bacterium]